MQCNVVVDSREHSTALEVINELKRLGCTIIERAIEAGDYVISDTTVIERKKAMDFINSIIDGRLFDQAKRLIEHYQNPIILIEGDPWRAISRRSIHPHSVAGAMVALNKMGIRVLYSANESLTAYIIFSLAKVDEGKPIKAVTARKGETIRELQVQLLGSLPGIGGKRAEKILMEFGTPLTALNNFESWSKINGISEKTIAAVRKVLTTRYSDGAEERLGNGNNILDFIE
ncbi:MAG: ERCC4 domain-containing protein [Thermocladium sp.]|jgi:DNA excision repair protein ERCC-4|nr:MAG: hypothetical protein AT710_09305 [Thermocladium sp. ECH_B]